MRARGCVRAHTHRLHVWQGRGTWNTDFYFFSNTNLIFEHEFYFFEHELNELNES